MKKIILFFVVMLFAIQPARAKQIMTGGTEVIAVPANTTVYAGIMGYFTTAWLTTDAAAYQIIPTEGTIDQLTIRPSGSTTQNVTATVILNGNATPLTASMNGAANGHDTTHTVSVSPGDRVSLRIVTAVGASSRAYNWSMRFTPARAGETILLGNTVNTAPAANQYVGISSVAVPDNTESKRTMIIPEASGILKKFYVAVDTAPGAGTSVSFTVFNNAVSGNNVVTISNTNTSNSDTSHSDTIAAAGNTASIKTTVSGAATLSPFHWGIAYVTPTPGNFLLLASSGTGGIAAGTYFAPHVGYRSLSVSLVNLVSNAFTAKAIYNSLLVAPGVGKSYDFTLMQNTLATALTVNQSGANLTSNFATDVSIATDDILSVKVVNNGATASGLPWRFSILGYLAESTASGNFFSGM